MNFNELIKNNKSNVKNIIKLITKEENEDLEQEVYIKAWKNKEKYTEKGKFKSWINTISKNISKDYLKSAKFQKEKLNNEDNFFDTVTDKKQTPEELFTSKQRQKLITKAINELKPKYKEVIVLAEINNEKLNDISKKLKCPIGTVKSRIYNAKKELYEKLKDLI